MAQEEVEQNKKAIRMYRKSPDEQVYIKQKTERKGRRVRLPLSPVILCMMAFACIFGLGGCRKNPAAGDTQDAVSEAETGTETDEGTKNGEASETGTEEGTVYDWDEMEVVETVPLSYATQFLAEQYEGGYYLITVAGETRYLVVPEGMREPENLPEDITVIGQGSDHIYLVATSAMDLFRAIDGIGNIRLCGTKADGWYIEEAKEAIESGEMLYAGKYSAPDYELLVSEGCDLAIESTMIYHSPDIQEQIEELGIPVFVEHSSYENHPLGRLEWIKVYGILLGKEEEADSYFEEQVESLSDVLEDESTGKTVAFFYITTNGTANVHKYGGYISAMIELSGGVYAFEGLTGDEDSAVSTMNMQMEDFYLAAKDADVLIYNSSIDNELTTMDELLDKSELLADFKAVQEGNVWCTGKSVFQETTGFAALMLDIHRILTDGDVSDEELNYLYRLE
ncbi:MAG: ABC transporter substrate-binding protein [Clostridiales bacterium]|nr:ABC transporter substrate-binding protein [Clostridiales bacterium]